MYREPIWNSKNINRKKGDTDFEQCGWCSYSGSGSYKYNCMIEGNCNLLKRYDKEVTFDTDCKIVKFGKLDIASIIESKINEIEEYKNMIKNRNNEINILQNLQINNIPILPHNRKFDHFNIDDNIWR